MLNQVAYKKMAKKTKKLHLSRYELIIFDFDGVIADSLGSYRELDRLLIKDLYGVDEKMKKIKKMSKMIAASTTTNGEKEYYRYLDKKYGDGKKSLEEIYNKLFELSPIVQANIKPKPGAVNAMNIIKKKANCKVSLATGSNRDDIEFFSTKNSKFTKHLELKKYFDIIITSDDVVNQKPDPEPFLKIIEKYDVNPKNVLIFEDSLPGVFAGKSIGATVVAIEDVFNSKNKRKIAKMADLYLDNWDQLEIED